MISCVISCPVLDRFPSASEEEEEVEGRANLTIDDFLGETETIGLLVGGWVGWLTMLLVAGQLEEGGGEEDAMFTELITRASAQTWDTVGAASESSLPPPLQLQENLRSLKLDLLSSIFQVRAPHSISISPLHTALQGLYPTEGDTEMVKHFISCPASLEVSLAKCLFALSNS